MDADGLRLDIDELAERITYEVDDIIHLDHYLPGKNKPLPPYTILNKNVKYLRFMTLLSL